MTPLDRITPALRSPLLPLAMLLLALSTVFVFAGDRGYFYRPGGGHNWISSQHLTIAVNLSPKHGFQRFHRRFIDDDGSTRFMPYNRFPIGGYAAMKLAALPFGESPSAQITAARILMLLLFVGAAVLAYLSLGRLTHNRWIALTATLLAFSSYYLLYFNDMIANDGMIDFFGVMLTFHGMVVFVQEGRFRQLLVKACIALLLGWHVLALLLPFVILGLASDLLRARSAAATSTPPSPVYVKLKHAASALFRSRYLLLGAAALGFGLSVLTFNFTMEYAALNGEIPLTELPSFKAMLRRTSLDQGIFQASPPWRPFLEGQFSKIPQTFIPYALLGGSGTSESPTWLSNHLAVVLGIDLSVAGLVGSIFVRPRILFATLASFGFFWAMPMRNNSAAHDFELIYYIGLPLVFFTIALLLARKVTNRDGVIAAAVVAALLLFAASSFQMSRVGHSAKATQNARVAAQDLLAIRDLTAGDLVTVTPVGGDYKSLSGVAVHAVDYYLNTSLIRYRDLSSVEGGFVVMRKRVDTDALLTPQNQYFFLYDRDGLMAWYGAKYRSVASTEPLARKEFDVYLIDGTVYYLKEPCKRADTWTRFFLHVFPEAIDDLPDGRRQHGFNNLDFAFDVRGVLFDGKCLAAVSLPQYAIARITTGQFDSAGHVWQVKFAPDTRE